MWLTAIRCRRSGAPSTMAPSSAYLSAISKPCAQNLIGWAPRPLATCEELSRSPPSASARARVSSNCRAVGNLMAIMRAAFRGQRDHRQESLLHSKADICISERHLLSGAVRRIAGQQILARYGCGAEHEDCDCAHAG